jgi:hypothetical protein
MDKVAYDQYFKMAKWNSLQIIVAFIYSNFKIVSIGKELLVYY